MKSDQHWMQVALELAKRGQGYVEPNPMVGCVVVRQGELIASGFHQRFGGPHAEVNALDGLDAQTVSESTIYVTLEPCAHYGKTPPCVELLLKKPPARVVIAMEDPFEQVAGLGIGKLKQAGIDVTVGVLGDQARELNAPYLKRLSSRLPWVIAKWAMTLDGAIATSTGDSKWISNELSRQQVHRLRSRVDAILVGSSTVLADDPMLTARLGAGESVARKAIRVVLDRRFRIGSSSQLVRTARQTPVWVVVDPRVLRSMPQKRSEFEESGVEFLELDVQSAVDVSQAELTQVLCAIASRGGTNVLVEGGAGVLGSFFDAKLVDQVECYIAPRVIGGQDARRAVAGFGVESIARGCEFQSIRWDAIDGDLHFSGVVARCPAR
ncbi:MAG: bifunctional diaminohydroxyphosphoribosylaminopyrimidine deaminase/5-amino-6-(5-phosphoribosylamino)uracil reductase RibD [Planctomycetaceae bacterium]|jgi:diaminohydroxyphosphoribosylaminopyrimidine deaminase/5-amino-6-(5-phosphoribosylamino)uracil reductase|nr:bifunctional diaminohydroxyphosphoribosylaminopyrimidine deaminase/5-amino-6-(5-phosphoribosylamino)uracil reductase RibD [Planctomycetaceae bacterium]